MKIDREMLKLHALRAVRLKIVALLEKDFLMKRERDASVAVLYEGNTIIVLRFCVSM